MRGRLLDILAATGLAAVLSCAVLTGCTESANDGGAADGGDDAAIEQVEIDQTETDATDDPDGGLILDDGEGEMVVPDGTTDVMGTIEVGSFSFVIPQYWANRVECYTSSDGEGADTATIYLPGNADAELCRLVLAEGDEPFSMGDIGSHVVGSVADGNGNHVEVWTHNWPWIAASGSDSGLREDELALLVDLSTEGQLTLEGVRAAGADEVAMVEASYTSATIVPTIAFG